MSIKQLTCIACPRGCALTVLIAPNKTRDEDGAVSVSGNLCPKGIEYGTQEAICPMRILTTTVACLDGGRIPVKTSAEIPLAQIRQCMNEIRELKPVPRTVCGTVLAHNLLGGKTDLVATG